MAINHFLLVYDRAAEEIVTLEQFGTDAKRATTAYSVTEGEYRDRVDRDNFEIVLIGADSLETLQVTHSRYFAELDLLPFS